MMPALEIIDYRTERLLEQLILNLPSTKQANLVPAAFFSHNWNPEDLTEADYLDFIHRLGWKPTVERLQRKS